MTKHKIQFTQDFESIRILINGLPHLYIIKKYFQGFSAYKQHGIYYIEIYINSVVLVAHEDKNNWMQILKLLNDNL